MINDIIEDRSDTRFTFMNQSYVGYICSFTIFRHMMRFYQIIVLYGVTIRMLNSGI